MTLCPYIFGNEKAPTMTGPAGDYLRSSLRGSLRSMETVAGECFLRYRILH